MGLQFFPDRRAALREARRVLVAGGRLVLNVPGPTPTIFAFLAEALARHVNRQAAQFVHQVFSLHEAAALGDLLISSGFVDVSSLARTEKLRLPAPGEFLWQYLHSTPLAVVAAEMGAESRAALERDVVAEWEPFVECGALILPLRVVTATAHAT
jgi:hypothetical protein